MKEIIELNKSREEAEVKIAEKIKEAVVDPEFYKLGLDVVSEILDKSDIIDSDSISSIISLGYKEYGEKVLILLPHIKCEMLSIQNKVDKLRKIKNIFKCMEFIPIIRELTLVIQKMITNGKEKDIEEGEFEIDWENEYNEMKVKYEMMKKEISITKQLQIRNRIKNEEKEKRKYTKEELDTIENIIETKDVNGAIEEFSKDPSLIYGDFLHQCAKSGWKEGVEMALDICFIFDDFVNRRSIDVLERAALICASDKGHLEVVEYLVEKGANIEAKDKNGATSLMCASEGGHLEVVKYLVEKRANIEAKDNNGATVLMCASDKGHLEVVKYLVEKGVNIEEKDGYRITALMYASDKGHLEVVKYLVEKGANIEAKDNNEDTALICASGGGHLEVVKYLVEKGANIEEMDNYGTTALMYASDKGHLEVVEYLKFIQKESMT